MVPVTRVTTSGAPAVGMFGGVAPEGIDAEEGRRAPWSQEEEEQRDQEREKHGRDPWAVRFEIGDKTNPKVNFSNLPCLVELS